MHMSHHQEKILKDEKRTEEERRIWIDREIAVRNERTIRAGVAKIGIVTETAVEEMSRRAEVQERVSKRAWKEEIRPDRIKT